MLYIFLEEGDWDFPSQQKWFFLYDLQTQFKAAVWVSAPRWWCNLWAKAQKRPTCSVAKCLCLIEHSSAICALEPDEKKAMWKKVVKMSAIMKCGDCGEPISGTYFQLGAKTICEQDYEVSSKSWQWSKGMSLLCSILASTLENKLIKRVVFQKNYRKKCSVCGEGVSGSYYTDKNGQIICANDYKVRWTWKSSKENYNKQLSLPSDQTPPVPTLKATSVSQNPNPALLFCTTEKSWFFWCFIWRNAQSSHC